MLGPGWGPAVQVNLRTWRAMGRYRANWISGLIILAKVLVIACVPSHGTPSKGFGSILLYLYEEQRQRHTMTPANQALVS